MFFEAPIQFNTIKQALGMPVGRYGGKTGKVILEKYYWFIIWFSITIFWNDPNSLTFMQVSSWFKVFH